MRKTLNENPVAQVVAVGILVIIVGFLFITRIAGQGSDSETPAPAVTAAPATPATETSAAPAAVDPAATATAPASGLAVPAAGGASGFEPGPGLPKAVVNAYEGGSTVVLLVVRKGGIDDAKLAGSIGAAKEGGRVALFVVDTKQVADYSRITEGVDVDRAPALVVVEPKRVAQGPLPEATVDYGFRGPQSIRQAVSDVAYDGRANVPYYPE